MKYNRFNLFLLLSFVAVSCLGQEISVSDNLSGLFEKLERQPLHSVVICNAFTTRFDILEAAARLGTSVDVIAKKKNISDYYSKVKDKKAVIGYHANLHDKIALTYGSKGWSADIGSANFSVNHFSNTEVVLHIPDAIKMPGLMDHVTKLFEKSTLSESVSHTPRMPVLPSKKKVFPDKRRGSLTSEGVVSCFNFKSKNSSLVSWMANRIKVDEAREYWISTMNLDHPVFIERIKQAVRNGSAFSIIVDKNEKHLTDGHAILDLSQFAQKYSSKIVLVWKKGRNTESNIHHAKLFIRSSNSRGENGLTIVPTANFTKMGGTEFNCAVVLPHDSASSDTIKALREKFNVWWKYIKHVPSASIPRTLSVKSDPSKIADYVISGIVPNQSCTYYLTTGAWRNKSCTDSISKALALSNGSVFKIMLLKKWIKGDTKSYQNLKKLAIQHSDSIEIKSWDKGLKKKEIGGKRILTKGFTVFMRLPSYSDTGCLAIAPANLTTTKKSENDTCSTDPRAVLKAIKDFKRIFGGATVIN